MLKSLKITNIALIEDVEISFGPKLNILSGETGAGKSIILNSLFLILGDQAKTELIRTGEEKARVHAVFDISAYPELILYLEKDLGIAMPEPLLIIDREIDSQKGSAAFINNQRVLLSTLKTLGVFLVDIHGQHQNQSLLDKSNHLKLLDKYANLEEEVKEYRLGFQKAMVLNRELKERQKKEEEKEKSEDYFRFSLKEIEKANLKEGEEEELDAELKKLSFFEEIKNTLQESFEMLFDNENSALTLLQKTLGLFEKIKDKELQIKSVLPFLQDSLLKLEPVVDFLKTYKEQVSFSPQKMQEISLRLEKIRDLKAKYGKSIGDIFLYAKNLTKELEEIEKNQEIIEELESNIEILRQDLAKKALKISFMRQNTAYKLEQAIEHELYFLGMEKAKIKISFDFLTDPDGKVKDEQGNTYKLSKDGIERVEFLISPNLGETAKPLNKIASGGELSRIMLSIKNILRKIDPIISLVFDEVDAGIGGKTALAVGEKLKEIAQDKQALCITHLPQIACMGDNHYKVEKIEENQRTKTIIYALSDDDRVEEISRMLSGDTLTDISLEHARQFLQKQGHL